MKNLFVRPKKAPSKTPSKPRSVVGASAPDAQRLVHPATRDQDAKNLEKVQQSRVLQPPTRKVPPK